MQMNMQYTTENIVYVDNCRGMYKERIRRICVLINAKVERQNALRKHSADYKIEFLNYIALINSSTYLKSQIRKINRGKKRERK